MSIEFSTAELWKVLDAITTYKKDYELHDSIKKTFQSIEKKVKKEIKSVTSGSNG